MDTMAMQITASEVMDEAHYVPMLKSLDVICVIGTPRSLKREFVVFVLVAIASDLLLSRTLWVCVAV